LKPIREAFGFDRAIDIATSLLDQFISEKKKEGKAPATINREIVALKQAFNFAKKQGRVTEVPYFSMLRQDNAR
jgi:site-specific recombinase XerD